MKIILFIGMDVHKESYSLCCYDKESGEISREVRCAADPKLIKKYIDGIKKDLTAVKNGIIYSYNNGLAEGSVNKIKVIKRIMYGRNSFELLKTKVLFGELFHAKFN